MSLLAGLPTSEYGNPFSRWFDFPNLHTDNNILPKKKSAFRRDAFPGPLVKMSIIKIFDKKGSQERRNATEGASPSRAVFSIVVNH